MIFGMLQEEEEEERPGGGVQQVAIKVTMHMSLLLRFLLAGVGGVLLAGGGAVNGVAVTGAFADTGETGDRDQAIAGVEASLLSLLGFAKRPARPMGSTHVPESLKKLYIRQSAIGISDIARPGIHARSSNTVRSFPHVGQYIYTIYI